MNHQRKLFSMLRIIAPPALFAIIAWVLHKEMEMSLTISLAVAAVVAVADYAALTWLMNRNSEQ